MNQTERFNVDRSYWQGASHASLQRQALIVVSLYVAGAGTWIAVSDLVLGRIVEDPELLIEFSVFKGFTFVAATAGLLYLLLRRTLRTIEAAITAAARKEAERRLYERERHQADAVVEQEQAFASNLIEAMPGIFCFFNSKGQFLRWNHNFEQVSGYSAEEIAQMRPLDFFAPEDKPLIERQITEAFTTGETTVEASFLAKTGARPPHFFTGKRIEFDGAPCVVGVGVDLAQRKQAEVALKKSEARYRTTLDNILEGCQLLDFNWRCLYLNDAAAAQNRRPKAEILGYKIPDAWPGIESTQAYSHFKRCMEQRVPVREVTPFTFPDGHEGWFDVRVQPVPEGILILSIDITENKRAERALRDLNQSLELKVAERTLDLDRAKERAEVADRLKSAFLATMSHELRTPLNSIIGFTGIVLQGLAGPLTAEQTKQLGLVQGSARHLLALINDVLDISKIEAGQLEVRATAFDLRASIERVTASVSPLAGKKGLALRVLLPGTLGPMVSDPGRIEQVLINLLNNAIKFTEHGAVTLTAEVIESPGAAQAEHSTPLVRIHVADTGIGIKAEDLTKLFQPFRQIDSGLQRQHEGTGLGLAISLRLTELLGGTIGVESAWGQGSTFTVTLPMKRGAH